VGFFLHGEKYAPILILLIWFTWCNRNRIHDWWWRNQGVSRLHEREKV